jgi:hypothetical protein
MNPYVVQIIQYREKLKTVYPEIRNKNLSVVFSSVKNDMLRAAYQTKKCVPKKRKGMKEKSFVDSFGNFVHQFKKQKLLESAYGVGTTGLLCMVDQAVTTIKPHHAIVTTETDGYLVSVLKQPTQNKDSYVEVMLTENHPLYQRFHDAVAVLNVAGTQNEVEGVGEAFQTGIYHVVLDVEEHKLLAGV